MILFCEVPAVTLSQPKSLSEPAFFWASERVSGGSPTADYTPGLSVFGHDRSGPPRESPFPSLARREAQDHPYLILTGAGQGSPPRHLKNRSWCAFRSRSRSARSVPPHSTHCSTTPATRSTVARVSDTACARSYADGNGPDGWRFAWTTSATRWTRSTGGGPSGSGCSSNAPTTACSNWWCCPTPAMTTPARST
jgi:hypothetical protein